MRIARLVVPTLFTLVCLLPGCSFLPCMERRHDSGLALVCADRIPDPPEALKAAASFGRDLAEDHPDTLGFPWADPATGELEMRITDPSGEAIVRDWIDHGAARTTVKPGTLPKPAAPVRLVASDRSFRQLIDIQNGVVPATGFPDGDAIYQVGPDAKRNAIVITVDRLSDPLLRALAARYGTTAIVIRVDPDRPVTGY